jgi:hypothetical protein
MLVLHRRLRARSIHTSRTHALGRTCKVEHERTRRVREPETNRDRTVNGSVERLRDSEVQLVAHVDEALRPLLRERERHARRGHA